MIKIITWIILGILIEKTIKEKIIYNTDKEDYLDFSKDTKTDSTVSIMKGINC